MVEAKIYMKSGNVIEFKCEDIIITQNGFGNITGYKITHGDSKERLLDVSIENIEGITTKELVV
ncbi:hypothetical protein [Clostridium ihumii]|uniref:hypothetical protein n=1 Tax=Clostridium ihumii TaxID=1470356 RepID=UPI00058CA8E3|nr:hypothetical protein [Clostridium ihumii]